MPVATLDPSQAARALAQANEVKWGRAKQRARLMGAPEALVRAAIIDPTPELGSYPLGTLLAPRFRPGLVWRVGPAKLRAAFHAIEARYPRGRRWNTETRLRELTRPERERLVQAVFEQAPSSRRQAA